MEACLLILQGRAQHRMLKNFTLPRLSRSTRTEQKKEELETLPAQVTRGDEWDIFEEERVNYAVISESEDHGEPATDQADQTETKELENAQQSEPEDEFVDTPQETEIEEEVGDIDYEDVDEDTLRDQKHVRFEGEAAEDYTQGPARMVFADDGVQQDCAALLMKLDLSAKIQRLIRIQRLYAREQRHADAQIDEIDKFESTLSIEVDNYDSRIEDAIDEQEPSPKRDQKVADLKQKMQMMKEMMENLTSKRARIENNLASRQSILVKAQANVTAYLDEAFTHALLMDPDEEDEFPVESFDLQEEYQKACREAEDPEQDYRADTPEPLETGDDFMRPRVPTPTPEQQAAAESADSIRQAKERIQDAQTQFNRKEWDRYQEQLYCDDVMQRGEEPPHASKEDFDLHWLARFREVSHELVEAEKAYDEAKAQARGAGLPIPVDCQSGHVDNCGEYELSEEIDTDVYREEVTPAVDSWLTDVPEDAYDAFEAAVATNASDNEDIDPSDSVSVAGRRKSLVEVDDWDSQSLAVGESFSAVAESSNRKKIDEWQRACGLSKQ